MNPKVILTDVYLAGPKSQDFLLWTFSVRACVRICRATSCVAVFCAFTFCDFTCCVLACVRVSGMFGAVQRDF